MYRQERNMMNRRLLLGVSLLLLLHVACVAWAASSSGTVDFSSSLPSTASIPTSPSAATSTTPTTNTNSTSFSTLAFAESPPPPPENTTKAPIVPEKWANMTLEFFAIFVSIAGGVGVVSFIVIALLCCRENKLLETSDDSDDELEYADSRSTTSFIPDDELDYADDVTSQTARSWDAESNPATPQNEEAASNGKPHRHRHRHRRHRSRSRNVSTPSSEEDDTAADEFWSP